jgi:hypothetical protein
MTLLDVDLLFDPRFDILRPKLGTVNSAQVRASTLNGKLTVLIPTKMSGRLAYLIGVVIGDGYLSKPIKRKSHGGGFHWKLVITGTHDYVVRLRESFFAVFDLYGGRIRDERKNDCWQLRFSSLLLHRFFSRVIGLPAGRKTTHGSWSRLELVREHPYQFLAGLIDSDGHISSHLIGIIQKRFRFLIRIKKFAMETCGLAFHGPLVNNRKNGEVTSWIIAIHKREERERLLHSINRLSLLELASTKEYSSRK